MRIATFNLESLDFDNRAGASFDDRLAVLRPQLQRLGADVICLQEVNSQRRQGESERSFHALDALLAGTPYEHFYRAAVGRSNRGDISDVHNLVVLSRMEILCNERIFHDLIQPLKYTQATGDEAVAGDGAVEWDRPVQQVDLDIGAERILTVFNTHLRAPLASPIQGQKIGPFVWRSVSGWAEGYFISALKRTGQALELRLAIDRILDKEPARLLAVCGDFNSTDHETAFRIIAGAEEDTGNGQLASRSLVPLERSVPSDRRYTVLHHGRPQMLDHVLVSRSLLGHFRMLEIHNETIEDELVGFAKVDRAPDSYHAPIVAEFALN